MSKWKTLFGSQQFEWIFISLVTLVVLFSSIRDYQAGFEMRDGEKHSKINNYYIFAHSFNELVSGGDLYVLHREYHYDYYKYSPFFAMFMAPFALMPDVFGLICWSLLNLFCLYFGLKMLPGLRRHQVVGVMLISAMELVGSIMNEQSNGLMVGLPLMFLALMERDKPVPAILMIVLSIYIKLYSVVFLMFLLFYPRFLKNVLTTIGIVVLFAVLPVLITGPDQLIFLYKSWLNLLQNDHAESFGYSVLGIFHSWFGLDLNKMALLIVGALGMVLPLLRINQFRYQGYRYALFAAALIWVIIFNHKAESPAFVVMMAGAGLWYVILPKKNKWDHFLLIFSLAFVSIAFSDLTPKPIREEIFYQYALKALPGLFLWGYIIWELVLKGERFRMNLE